MQEVLSAPSVIKLRFEGEPGSKSFDSWLEEFARKILEMEMNGGVRYRTELRHLHTIDAGNLARFVDPADRERIWHGLHKAAQFRTFTRNIGGKILCCLSLGFTAQMASAAINRSSKP